MGQHPTLSDYYGQQISLWEKYLCMEFALGKVLVGKVCISRLGILFCLQNKNIVN